MGARRGFACRSNRTRRVRRLRLVALSWLLSYKDGTGSTRSARAEDACSGSRAIRSSGRIAGRRARQCSTPAAPVLSRTESGALKAELEKGS